MFVHGAANPRQSFHDSPRVATIFSAISADLQLDCLEALVETDLKLAKIDATVVITNKSADLLAGAFSLHFKVIPVVVLLEAARPLLCFAWASALLEGLVLSPARLFMLVLASISFTIEEVVDVGGLFQPVFVIAEMSSPAVVLIL